MSAMWPIAFFISYILAGVAVARVWHRYVTPFGGLDAGAFVIMWPFCVFTWAIFGLLQALRWMVFR